MLAVMASFAEQLTKTKCALLFHLLTLATKPHVCLLKTVCLLETPSPPRIIWELKV